MSSVFNTPQMALPLMHSDKASFSNFWPGRNQEVVSTIRACVETFETDIANQHTFLTTAHEKPLADEKPLAVDDKKVVYFYGPSGAGKSHLLFSVARLAKERDINTSYVSLDDPRLTGEMLALIKVQGLVCVDNIHVWAGEENKERSLFTLFEQIKHAGGQLLISAKQPPESSGFLINDLVSRLASGLIYPLHALNDNERPAALKMRANQRGMKISDDSVTYLLSRLSRDPGDLFDVLDRIDKASLEEKRRITIPFLQRLLK